MAATSFDDIILKLGEFGKYQRRMLLLVFCMSLPVSMHAFVQVFLAAYTDHWCAPPPELQRSNCSDWTLPTGTTCDEAKKELYIPKTKSAYEQCSRYNISYLADIEVPEVNNQSEIISCDNGWVFDHSEYESTIVQSFYLVCDDKKLPNYAQSIFFVGTLFGSIVMGILSDRIGRKPTLFMGIAVQVVFGVATAFSPNFWSYAFFRFFVAAANSGIYLTAFVIGAEFVGPSRRTASGVFIAVVFALGFMILALLAFLIRNWQILQIVITLPVLVAFLFIRVVPESARWLISHQKFDEAEKIIRNISRVNGVELSADIFNQETRKQFLDEHAKVKQKNASVLDLFRRPNTRNITININFIWFVNMLVYVGLSITTASLGWNNYLAFFFSGLVEIPADLICLYIMERWGRRTPLSCFMVLGGLACLLNTFMPKGAARTTVGMIGKFAITASYTLVYIYTAELYATPVRAMGMGLATTTARISAILTPLVLLLSDSWPPLPLLIFGASSLMGGLATLFLPETVGRHLPETLEEAEIMAKGRGLMFWKGKDSYSKAGTDNVDNGAKPRAI
ncbi:organic cation transporter protein-like [Amphiura filiformis]|uniref:organic cation transporter protein-like n=1 Tax=Amphiura filiformis TaxID=82378 RepID=UPI003B22584B